MVAKPATIPVPESTTLLSRQPLWRDFATGAASGAIAFLASPPLSLAWLLPTALLPWFLVCARAAPAGWLAAGLGFGIAYVPSVPLGLLLFGIPNVAAFWLALLAFFAIIFLVSGALARRMPLSAAPLALPVVWTATAWLLDEWLYAPVLLSAPLALDYGRAIQIVGLIGAPALDALLLSIAALLAIAVTSPGVRVPAVVGLAAVALLLCMPLPTPKVRGTAQVAIVQPDIPWHEYRAAGWSHLTRRSIEQKLDQLTRDAATMSGQQGSSHLIVWPENGNMLPNMQLARRLQPLQLILTGTEHELLLPGKEVFEDRKYLSAWLIDHEEVRGLARKSHLVPLIEASLAAGRSGVIASRQTIVGVALCYDAMFGRHFRDQLSQGASLFIVTTDDASLGVTLGEWHAGYAMLRAIEAGRSLVFVSNRGPSRVYDVATKRGRDAVARDRQAVATVSVSLNQRTSPASAGLRHLVPLASALFMLALVLRNRQKHAPRVSDSSALTLLPCVLVLLPTALLAEVLASGWLAKVSAQEVLEEGWSRLMGPAAADSIGPLFQQTNENTCGAAAMAFALHVLGDDIFEHDIVQAIPHAAPEGYSLAELKKIAETRGFRAAGFAGSLRSLEKLGNDLAIIHTRSGHFSVVWNRHREGFHLFDPAAGRIFTVPPHRLVEWWSGYYLRIGLKPVEEIWTPPR